VLAAWRVEWLGGAEPWPLRAPGRPWPSDLPQKWTIHLGRSAPSVVVITATRNTRVKVASLAPDFYKALIALDAESATELENPL
jgi:hypothetical protein